MLLSLAALPVQIEEISDVEPDLEARLLSQLGAALQARTGEEARVVDCRMVSCEPRDATAETERVHVLVFGGPTRISFSAERLGRGRALRASQFVQSDGSDPRPALEALARELFPDVTERRASLGPEVLPVQQTGVEPSRGGPSALTVGGLIVSGVALAGSLTFGLMARSAQSELDAKQVYDDEVPGLQSASARNTSIALTLLGVGVAAGVVAILAEALD